MKFEQVKRLQKTFRFLSKFKKYTNHFYLKPDGRFFLMDKGGFLVEGMISVTMYLEPVHETTIYQLPESKDTELKIMNLENSELSMIEDFDNWVTEKYLTNELARFSLDKKFTRQLNKTDIKKEIEVDGNLEQIIYRPSFVEFSVQENSVTLNVVRGGSYGNVSFTLSAKQSIDKQFSRAVDFEILKFLTNEQFEVTIYDKTIVFYGTEMDIIFYVGCKNTLISFSPTEYEELIEFFEDIQIDESNVQLVDAIDKIKNKFY